MKALQYPSVGAAPVVVTVRDPEPGPGQVLLKVTAAGACHSDIAVMEMTADQLSFPLPLTLGHEGVGTVAALGPGASGVSVGDSVAVYGPWGCGVCRMCAQGKENYCLRADAERIFPPGLGEPGSMAEYLLVDDARHLVPIGDLDPVTTVPLTDAGLTPYHAVKLSLAKLVPGSTAVVIGAGGLGHVGIQLLRAMTASRVIALDVTEGKLELARTVGAHEALLSDDKAPARIRELTGGVGASVVLDFVGAPPTVALAGKSVGVEGDVTVVGLGGGALPVGFGTLPHETTVRSPYWGTRSEFAELIELARQDVLDIHVETFSLDEAPRAYELLTSGNINGRAVIVP
ncbi:NAD(P)-dependent alcohol dehydrogenase [Streptomyces sp. HNM0574]|uniref:NAD(P)-dependent alcohol dehydrogenase n=1 Tax=Streptomyces sp. HNM0574 TaxID=2714954 RepID=UPI00146A1BAF|nr:NAD(P)-dependent alcohol dehydrogenase [Streptomyces sp. HNM0574]NLU70614.1 NAD(P)-dependent alcohol dehydrogenase [Streptomyces sp. HNM0574]